MRVRCLSNRGSGLPFSALDERVGLTRESRFPLTIGSEYAVLAVTPSRGLSWVHVMDDDGFTYPVWYPIDLFEVADPSVPPSWICCSQGGRGKRPARAVLSFPEWAGDASFYERLVGDDPAALAVLTKRRREVE